MATDVNFLADRVLFFVKNRKTKTLKRFSYKLSISQRKKIEALGRDMWGPFIKAARDKLPLPKIVFDLLDVAVHFDRVIDKVRNRETQHLKGR